MTDRLTIEQILADCERYWRETKVPKSRVREMSTELKSHLLDATAEGKAPEVVVGNLPEFAEAWASEYRDPASPEAWGDAAKRAVWKRDVKAAYGWLAVVAAVLLVLTFFGPKEANVDDVELWRWIWTIGAAVLGVGEMLTAGLFMLPFAIGAGAAAILAFAGVAVAVQIGVFIAVSILSLWGMQRFAWREGEPEHSIGALRYVDAKATVTETIDRVEGTGRVRLDTESWRATTLLDVPIEPGVEVRVVEVTGARLVVEPMD